MHWFNKYKNLPMLFWIKLSLISGKINLNKGEYLSEFIDDVMKLEFVYKLDEIVIKKNLSNQLTNSYEF